MTTRRAFIVGALLGLLALVGVRAIAHQADPRGGARSDVGRAPVLYLHTPTPPRNSISCAYAQVAQVLHLGAPATISTTRFEIVGVLLAPALVTLHAVNGDGTPGEAFAAALGTFQRIDGVPYMVADFGGVMAPADVAIAVHGPVRPRSARGTPTIGATETARFYRLPADPGSAWTSCGMGADDTLGFTLRVEGGVR